MSLETTTKPLIEVKDYLDELLNVDGLDADSNGLVVGGRPMITKVGLAVNCSLQVIASAELRRCDLLLTHHAAWPSTDAHLADQKYDRLRQLGINLYVAHDCLDQARGFGTPDALARAVRVAIQGPFKPDGEQEFGVHGLTTGHLPEFVTRVASQLGTEPRRWKNNESFGHVAVVPGWGGRPEWMARAQELGCDTFLTGEAIMFGLLFAKEAGINLILAGHAATEVPGVMALGSRIARDLKLDVTFIPEEIIEAKG
jgi:dinuclear metal center YbgI/SA1388 family protein